MTKEKLQPVFIMVPRKLIITWITINIVLFIGVIGSFQYTNYVDRSSNRLWCGMIVLFDDTYKKSPPPTPTGRILADEFRRLRSSFDCT